MELSLGGHTYLSNNLGQIWHITYFISLLIDLNPALIPNCICVVKCSLSVT